MSVPDVLPVDAAVEIDASRDTVFRYFTDIDRLERFLVARVEMDARPGGHFRFHFDAHATVVEGEVLELEPPRRLVWSWGVAAGPQRETLPVGSTRVVIDLEPLTRPGRADGTRLRLRHEGLPTEEERRDHEGGWREYLESLRLSASERC